MPLFFRYSREGRKVAAQETGAARNGDFPRPK